MLDLDQPLIPPAPQPVSKPPPRRFWRVTFWTADGSEHRRYVKCPYLVPVADEHGGKEHRRSLAPGDPDFVDTHLAMTARLGALEWDGIITSYRVTPVKPERVSVIRDRAVRWSEVEAMLVAA